MHGRASNHDRTGHAVGHRVAVLDLKQVLGVLRSRENFLGNWHGAKRTRRPIPMLNLKEAFTAPAELLSVSTRAEMLAPGVTTRRTQLTHDLTRPATRSGALSPRRELSGLAHAATITGRARNVRSPRLDGT
jgi:hypothetical protein